MLARVRIGLKLRTPATFHCKHPDLVNAGASVSHPSGADCGMHPLSYKHEYVALQWTPEPSAHETSCFSFIMKPQEDRQQQPRSSLPLMKW